MPDWARFVDASVRPEPTVLRVRTGRIAIDDLRGRLTEQGFRLRPVDGLPSLFRVEDGPFPVSMSLEHWLGLIYVQQASTAVAAPQLGAGPGERVLDLCSAPGGKTTHLAEAMEDRGCLVACEIDERRIRGLLGNVYRLAHPNVMVVAADGRTFPEGALFDRVLVDAPCSGEGTLRRRSGRPPDQSKSFLGYVTTAQRALLRRAVRLTRPGGTILYVTCTFAPEENEAVVSDVLNDSPVDLVPLDLAVPHAPGLTAFGDLRFDARLEGAARIYPQHLDSGGLFLAKLERTDERCDEGGDGQSGDEPRWCDVPVSFPDGAVTEAGAAEQVESALAEVSVRYGIDPSRHPSWGWLMRGGRAWLQTAGEWPVDAWPEGSWRVVSVGLRALEFDSAGRPRPTNDFLRMAGRDVRSAVEELTRDRLLTLLERHPVTTDLDIRGPVALSYEHEVVGRGAVTSAGLVSEIPKARAVDLKRVLAGLAG